MTPHTLPEEKPDIPTQVFKKFLESLKVAGLQDELAARFEKTLLEDRSFTDNDLKKAVFGKEILP